MKKAVSFSQLKVGARFWMHPDATEADVKTAPRKANVYSGFTNARGEMVGINHYVSDHTIVYVETD